MAYSKVTIVWNSVPNDGEVLNISESSLGNTMPQIFKNARLSTGQTAIPAEIQNLYSMTVADTVDIYSVGARYTPVNGDLTSTPLDLLPIIDGPGTYTFEIVSETPVIIYDIATGNDISWPYGSFSLIGGSGIYSGFISTNYKTAFNLDYNSTSLYTVNSTNGPVDSGTGTVVIIANFPGAVFVAGTNTSDAIVTIENESAVPEIHIIDSSLSEATTNKCQNVKVNIETDILAVKILSPVVVNPNTDNPFSFDWLRGQTINVLVEDANGKQASQSVTTPSVLTADNFEITANNSPNGGTAVIVPIGLSGLVLEYSLNNIDWQSENVFSGLTVGDYTAYIRDNFGCSTSKPFVVDEFNITEPYFYISKANSLRFAERVEWNDVTVFKTDENTLSCESDVKLPYQEIQDFKTEDVITTQFKSNYATNTVKTIDSAGVETNVPIYKKSNNIGIKDKRQAIKYNLGNSKTGIYFSAGNTYDFDTNVVNGSYVLNGGVPEWGRIGNYLQIGSAWFEIEQIIYDEAKTADVLVISNVYTGIDASIVVGSIYNRDNFEVYEFIVNMVDFEDNLFRVQINAENDLFPDKEFLSEQINVSDDVEDLLEIRYKNSSNTDINYSTGIEHLIRVPFNKIVGQYDEESETYKTDTTSKLLSADLYEVDEFIFEPNTKEIWRKINIALTHEFVVINGVSYVKNAGFNTEPLGETNLYVLSAAMVKTGNVYNSKSNDTFDYSEEPVEIPNLIETESGYVEY